MKRFIKRTFFGKKRLQSVFKRLFLLSLEGMNIGTGGGKASENGELFALGHAIAGVSEPVIFDVGAQGGDYLREALRITAGQAKIFAFEPRASDWQALRAEFEGSAPSASIERLALGDKEGETSLHYPEGVSGLSSVHKLDGSFTKSETVRMTTLDEFCTTRKIKKIDLLKLDIEGSELACLKGAKSMLPYIRSIQFEFGGPSRDARTYFRDIFSLLRDGDFDVFRILRDGLVKVSSPDKMSELLFTTNYLAIRKTS